VKRSWPKLGWRIYVPAGIVLLVLLSIDDWSRDWTSYAAEIQEDGPSGAAGPLVSTRPTAQLVEAARWGAARVGGYEFVGTSREDDRTSVAFVHVARPFGLRDDVTLRIRDVGARRVISGHSVSRLHIGDLGRNPRNLRRLLAEVDAVLDNAARDPAPFGAEAAAQ
jgi:Protein of unknown function (DUF1499)